MKENLLPSDCSYLITGGCVFIGTNLIRYILNNNQASRIRVLDNLAASTGMEQSVMERLGDMKRNYSDISKAIRILRYQPALDIHAGLKLTFKYFYKKITG